MNILNLAEDPATTNSVQVKFKMLLLTYKALYGLVPRYQQGPLLQPGSTHLTQRSQGKMVDNPLLIVSSKKAKARRICSLLRCLYCEITYQWKLDLPQPLQLFRNR